MTTIDTNSASGGAATAGLAQGRARALASLAGAALTWLDEKLERRRSRRALEEMTDAQLKDIGISRADAFREAHRPFWD